jgi:hypothetical protein
MANDVSFSRMNAERKMLEDSHRTHTPRYKELMRLLIGSTEEGTTKLNDDEEFADAHTA